MKIYISVIAAAALSFLTQSGMADEITGKVIGVSDGDTITVLVEKDGAKTPSKVRLAEIDAPESKQAFGTQAKKQLSDKVFGMAVKVEFTQSDRYGRIVGRVLLGERDINREMISEGYAWHYKQYSKNAILAKDQEQAKSAKKGLWADNAPTPPWSFRSDKKDKTNEENPVSAQNLTKKLADNPGEFWLNTSTGVRHNSTCKQYRQTKNGRMATAAEGKPCGNCGG